MDVCVLTNDLIFYSGVEGVAGAMGHSARQAEALSDVAGADLLIVDTSTARVSLEDVATAFEPLRTAIFTPHERVDVFAAARANGVAHVYRRGALAVELPGTARACGTGARPGGPRRGARVYSRVVLKEEDLREGRGLHQSR